MAWIETEARERVNTDCIAKLYVVKNGRLDEERYEVNAALCYGNSATICAIYVEPTSRDGVPAPNECMDDSDVAKLSAYREETVRKDHKAYNIAQEVASEIARIARSNVYMSRMAMAGLIAKVIDAKK